MTIVFGAVVVMLGAAGAITVLRLLLGPSVLDRVVALDMLLALVLCGLATFAAVTLDSSSVPVLVVVTLLGFVGSVSIARVIGQERR